MGPFGPIGVLEALEVLGPLVGCNASRGAQEEPTTARMPPSKAVERRCFIGVPKINHEKKKGGGLPVRPANCVRTKHRIWLFWRRSENATSAFIP